MNRLLGKVAVVTGATSGIGRAAAEAFAREGASVGVLARHGDAAEELARGLGTAAIALAADVREEDQVRLAFEKVRRQYGRLDVLYNCAGVQRRDADAPVDQLDLDVWRDTLDTNLTGMFLTSKHGIRLMLESGGGSVIHCGSPTGITGRGWRYHAYSASKGGIRALTKAMAVAYGSKNIRVNCVIPGTIRTAMTAGIFEAEPDRLSELTARTALGRLGEVADLVGIAVFLASDESAYATGATFVVDGGLLAT